MSFTVKAFLTKPDSGLGSQSQQEIRRFPVDADVGTSFVYLLEKITAVFPSLKNKSVELYWKDSENDLVAFSSDDELMEAVSYVSDGVLKVYVVVKGQGKPETPNAGVLHPHVTCDGCEGSVRGIRYKCKVCPDYDLCLACKSTGLHSEHEMTAIEKPLLFPFCGTANPIYGMAHFPPSPFGFFPPPPTPGMVPPPPPPFFNPNPASQEEMRMQRRAFRRWMRSTYGGDHCSMWKKGKKERKEEKKQEKMEQHAEKKARKEKAKAEASKEMPNVKKDSSSSSSSSDGESSPTDYLRNVGQSVAAMLDPLGIDVEVDVEHHGKRRHCHRGGWRRGPCGWGTRGHFGGHGWGFGRGGFCHMRGPFGTYGCNQSQAAGGQEPVPQGPPPPPGQYPVSQDIDTNSETGELRSGGFQMPTSTIITGDNAATASSYPEHNGWTLVTSAEEASMEDTTKGIEKLHVSGEDVADNLTEPQVVGDDKLEAALEKMRAMGYTNDDFVAALLLDNNYDIGHTIDAINSKK